MACEHVTNGRREWKPGTGLCNRCAADLGSRMYDQQNGKCAICNTPFGPRNAQGGVPHAAKLDHNHQTGQIRGGLCHECNVGLGLFKHDPSRLRAAAAYLEKWKQMASGQSR